MNSPVKDPPVRNGRPPHQDGRRRTARVPLGLVIAMLTLGTCLVAARPEPAEAAPGYRLGDVVSRQGLSDDNSRSAKNATALCPEGKVAVGGAANIFEMTSTGNEPGHITLTLAAPVHTLRGYGYKVAAAETPPGTTGDWYVVATALCTDAPPGYRVVTGTSESSSSAVKHAEAVCDGQVALGAGAMVTTDDLQAHGVGLQMVRASGTGDITRAQATEPPAGYPGIWILNAYAVCADRPDGYEVRYNDSQHVYARSRWAEATCTGNRVMLNAGAAVDAPANVTLYTTYPLTDRTRAYAYENTPTQADWTIAAQAICALD